MQLEYNTVLNISSNFCIDELDDEAIYQLQLRATDLFLCYSSFSSAKRVSHPQDFLSHSSTLAILRIRSGSTHQGVRELSHVPVTPR